MYTVEYTSGECKQRLKICTLYSTAGKQRKESWVCGGDNMQCPLSAQTSLKIEGRKGKNVWRSVWPGGRVKSPPLGCLWGLLNLKERSEGQKWKSRAVSHRKESPKVVITCRRLKLVFFWIKNSVGNLNCLHKMKIGISDRSWLIFQLNKSIGVWL